MDSNDYKMLMQFFPPVNGKIENIYTEAIQSYHNYKAISPLKVPEKDTTYSYQIMNDLKILRILLNSNLTPERFLYEINKMYDAWGPEGLYGRNILNAKFIDIFSTIKLKEQKLQDLMKEGGTIASDYQLGQLEKQLEDFSFKHKYNPSDFNDLNLENLSINFNSDKIPKSAKSIGKRKVISKRLIKR
jgi:hypothetical protein